jgi:hypothetical protein
MLRTISKQTGRALVASSSRCPLRSSGADYPRTVTLGIHFVNPGLGGLFRPTLKPAEEEAKSLFSNCLTGCQATTEKMCTVPYQVLGRCGPFSIAVSLAPGIDFRFVSVAIIGDGFHPDFETPFYADRGF